MTEVCGGILESYNISFRDCQDVVQNMVKLIDSILQTMPSNAAGPREDELSLTSEQNDTIDQTSTAK